MPVLPKTSQPGQDEPMAEPVPVVARAGDLFHQLDHHVGRALVDGADVDRPFGQEDFLVVLLPAGTS